jgi:glycosyltransferase involved in cell wall biosynthesis
MISVVIRTFNEERHLGELLQSIRMQNVDLGVEVVVVDSGSTDRTQSIARAMDCRIIHIEKSRFSFGRSLNLGCREARGQYLVFVSGHCIPVGPDWLRLLVAPLRAGDVQYTYGRQVAGPSTKFSERQHFRRYFPEHSAVPQEGFFCNNANAALLQSSWAELPFDEELTGLEDMAMAKAIVARGGRIGYVAEAPVYHLHDESWRTIRNRFEREAVALQGIMPQVHVTFADFARYLTSAILLDLGAALQEGRLLAEAFPVVAFRTMQFWGTYRGNNEHRRLSQAMKDRYFFPR